MTKYEDNLWRDIMDAHGDKLDDTGGSPRRGVRETVVAYLTDRIEKDNHPDPAAVLAAADELLAEVSR